MPEKKKPAARNPAARKPATAKRPRARQAAVKPAKAAKPTAKARAAKPKPSLVGGVPPAAGRLPASRRPSASPPEAIEVTAAASTPSAREKVEEVATPKASEGHAPLFDATGAHTGEYALPESLFAASTAGGVVRQAVLAALANARQANASTRNRSRVSGGGAKPWRQKGTGRARQGSTRAPHWRHGAVVFGPNGRVYEQRVPRKMRRLALAAALTSSARSGRVVVIEEVRLEGGPRTRDASALLARIGAGGDSVVITANAEAPSLRAFDNLTQVVLRTPRSLQLADVLVADHLIFAKDALGLLAELRA